MINLLRFRDKQKYLVYDTETCHLNLCKNNYCWNLSYLVCEGNKILHQFDRFPFWEPLPISKGAAQVTRFNYESYKSKSENPIKVLDHFESYLYNPEYLIIAHNQINFDFYVLNQYRKLLNRLTDYSYIDRCIDTNALCKAMLLNKKPGDSEKLINFQYRMQSILQKGLKTNVQAMCKHFGIDFDPNQAHAGLYDIQKTFEIYNKLIFQIDI